MPQKTLAELFAGDKKRLSNFTVEAAGLYFHWSKTHLDKALVDGFAKRLKSAGFERARADLFAGGIVNPSENRAATHAAERGSGAEEVVSEAIGRRLRMPLKGLYLCGSGAHPGGGVTGAPGHNAAKAILADRRFWKRGH